VEEAMRIMSAAVMAAMVGTNAWAGSIPVVKRQVTVCMSGSGNVALENRAKAVASGILAGGGVKIAWHSPGNCPREGIVITLSNETPVSMHPGALAYAQPYDGTHVVVFYDRVKNQPGILPLVKPTFVASLLGHVMVHEVTHILQGVVRHSESGVMKQQWTGVDYAEMSGKPLEFTDEDVVLIHLGLKRRDARLGAGATKAANVPPAAGP
jgi:hypothetical protein